MKAASTILIFLSLFNSNITAQTGPIGYTYLATEGQTVQLSQKSDLAYGANGVFTYKYDVTGSVSVNTTTFGGDPLPNVLKSLFYRPAAVKPIGPSGYTYMGSEGQLFMLMESVDIAYGANGVFGYKYGVSGNVTINSAITGYDPVPNVVKSAFFRTSTFPKYSGINFKRGDTLTVFKLAVSVSAELTAQNGGLESVKQKLNTWLEELNEIFGREYAIRFELVANNDKLIYTNAQTDPWPTVIPGEVCASAQPLLNIQKKTFDAVLGAGSYDISHIIADLGGGCAGSFDNGATGGISIGIAQHEIGHQFGQPHIINNNNATNYEFEQGGGWTIHSGNGYPYAHAATYHVTIDNILSTNKGKGVKILTGNTVPTVNAGLDYIIPISTPFKLTASSLDSDAGDKLTYVWDNMNPWFPKASVATSNDSAGVLFERFTPVVENYRTFPQMADIIANKNVGQYEQLPTKPRYIDMRLTVNDNHKMNYNGKIVNVSGVNSDDIRITVANAGPFVVTSQSTNNIVYNAGTTQQVTWQVNNTNLAPISATNVKISLSLDGGYNYPITLLASTSNNGAATVTIPYVTTQKARIKVEAIGNIFFDLNTSNFEIKNTICDLKEQISTNTGAWMNINSICVKSNSDVALGVEGTYDNNWKFTYTSPTGQVFLGGAIDELTLENLQQGGPESGSWLLSYTGPNGCVNSESFVVNVKNIDLDQRSAIYGKDWQPSNVVNLCEDGVVLLDIEGVFDANWSIVYSRPDGQIITPINEDVIWLFNLKNGGTSDGTWKVTYTDPNGCSNTESFYVNIHPLGGSCDGIVTDIENKIESNFILYPNPVTDILHLSNAEQWELYSNIGLKIKAGNGYNIDLTNYPKGIYMLKIQSKTYKIIKE